MFIFDASTLILIARIELLDAFLGGISEEVAIPVEVKRECCSVKKTADSLRIQQALDDSRMRVIPVKNVQLVSKLQNDFSLGKGEAESIALALNRKAKLVGIDDKNGINACKLVGLAFTTAAGILVRSHEKGSISRSEALFKLDLLAKFGRYRNSILEDVRGNLEARK